jgi:hypothetical protein
MMDAERFHLIGTSAEIPEVPGLSNTERAILRGLAEPGGALWKIMRSMVDYGEGLKQALMSADFDNPAQQAAIRKVQATYLATVWLQETLEAALTDVVEPELKEETNV